MSGNIHLGFELSTGDPVAIPLGHLAVSGQTQKSGKTTTLEALIARSGFRALAFVTKVGESAFKHSRTIRPYFRHRADWQFVSDILGAALNEKMKFQRFWIIEICRGAKTLKDVQRKNTEKLKAAKRGLDIAMFTELDEYLRLVVPELEALPFSTELDLAPGISVMDLSGYSLSLQMLVISSVLEHVYRHEKDLIVIVPEAWEFVPQKRGSPVMRAAEQLIRKSAARNIFVWLDSQDLAGVHKDILKHVSVWILGVQREENEVQRTLKHIFDKKPKIGVSDVRGLGLGQFFVCWGTETKKVYVQPAWMEQMIARDYVLGKIPFPAVDGYAWIGVEESQFHPGDLLHHDPHFEKEEAVWKEKYEAQCSRVEQLEADKFRLEKEHGEKLAEVLRLKRQVQNLREMLGHPRAEPAGAIPANELPTDMLEPYYQALRQRLIADASTDSDLQRALQVLTVQPEINVQVRHQVVEVDGTTLRGRLARLIAEDFFRAAATGNSAFNELQKRGASTAKPNVYRELDKLTEMGFLLKLPEGGYQAVPAMKVNIVEAA